MWGPEQQQSFDELRKRLSSAETLGYFDKNAPTKVIADASPVGLGAVLVQERGEELRVIVMQAAACLIQNADILRLRKRP